MRFVQAYATSSGTIAPSSPYLDQLKGPFELRTTTVLCFLATTMTPTRDKLSHSSCEGSVQIYVNLIVLAGALNSLVLTKRADLK